jgi:uncharacterized lipoprotein YajG
MILFRRIVLSAVVFIVLFAFNADSQDKAISIKSVENKIVLGDFAGNRDLAFGVENILEEVIQDAGYDLYPDAPNEITVDILFFDVQKNNVQIGVYGRNTDIYQIIARATLYNNGKKKKIATAKGTAKSISTATLIIDQGGQFSQANVSTAMKKLCEQLIEKLKI